MRRVPTVCNTGSIPVRLTKIESNASCAGGRRNMPPPPQVDLESGVIVTCDLGYLCAKFSLLRPLCSRPRPDVNDKQTSDRCQTRIIA